MIKKWNKARPRFASQGKYIDSRQIPNLLVLLSVVIYNNIGCDEMKWMNHRTGFIKYATPPRTTHKRSLSVPPSTRLNRERKKGLLGIDTTWPIGPRIP